MPAMETSWASFFVISKGWLKASLWIGFVKKILSLHLIFLTNKINFNYEKNYPAY